MESGAESPRPEVIQTNDELCRFLLPNSWNAQRLRGWELEWEVSIVGVNAHRNPDRMLRALLLDEIDIRTQEDTEKHHLNDTDSAALKKLYTGFSQSMLNRDGQEFAVRIEFGETTEWLGDEEYPPDNLRVKGMEYLSFRNPEEDRELLHVKNLEGDESVMKEQGILQELRASPELMKAVIGEFDRIAVVEGENRQLRKSSEGLFRFTVIQAPAHFSVTEDAGKKKEIFAVPIHRVGQFRG